MIRHIRASPARRRLDDARAFLVGVGTVAGIEVGDQVVHALAAPAEASLARAHAVQVMHLERSLGLWIEPGLQQFFLTRHTLLGCGIGAAQVEPFVNTVYGLGHIGITGCFALWVFLRRRPLFPFLCLVFALTGALTVLLRELVPLAPPRLALGLFYHGQPFRFVDTIFGRGDLQLGFNQYAAMPSLHMAWALLVGPALAYMARPLLVRLCGLLYPPIMLLVVVVTGNHYLIDALGALAVAAAALILALLVAWWRGPDASLGHLLRRMHAARRPRPLDVTASGRPASSWPARPRPAASRRSAPRPTRAGRPRSPPPAD